jgi:hypothetical protein
MSMERNEACVNRTIVMVLVAVALLSVAASGSSPWRHQRVYGWDIMTKQERAEFRVELRSFATYDRQLVFWRQHIERMKERAWNRGLLIDEPPEVIPPSAARGYRQAIFAHYLMSGEEIEAYRAKERSLTSKEEYDAFRREHEIAMKAKAWESGLPIGPTPAERKLREEKRKALEKGR